MFFWDLTPLKTSKFMNNINDEWDMLADMYYIANNNKFLKMYCLVPTKHTYMNLSDFLPILLFWYYHFKEWKIDKICDLL